MKPPIDMSLENTSSPLNRTDSTDEGDITADGDVYLVAAYVAVGLFVVIANSVVVVVVVASQELHRPTLWNITFMAVNDLAYGLYYLTVVAPSRLMNQFAYPESLRCLGYLLMAFLFGQNILNVLVAIVDRVLVVCFPLHYNRLMSGPRFIIAVVCTTLINVARILLIIFTDNVVYYNGHIGVLVLYYYNNNSWLRIHGTAGSDYNGHRSPPLLKVVYELRKSRQAVRSTASTRSSTQFTVTMALSAGVFLLCYLPSMVVVVWSLLFGGRAVRLCLVYQI